MTRVVYIAQGPAPYGSNRSLLALIDHGLAHGIKPLVIGSKPGPLSEWLEARSVPFKATGHRFSTYPKTDTITRRALFVPIFAASRILNTIALLRVLLICWKFRPDIIHTNIGPTSIGYLAARIMGVHHVWHLREYQDLDFGMHFFPSKSIFRKFLAGSSAVICVTQAIAAHFGYPKNASVISNGVASASAAALIMPKSSYFLFVGRLEPAKQVAQIVEAYLRHADSFSSPPRLLIAGDGDSTYIATLKDLLEGAPERARVEFLGFRNDTTELMRNARALIVASENEGFGRITAEAMFSGCLVIGKATAGTADILDSDLDEPLGLMFNTSSELTTQLNVAAGMCDERYREKVSKAQRKAVLNYSNELYGSKVLQVYADIGPKDPRATKELAR